MSLSPFEIGMLACFGISWPTAIAKSLRTKNVSGKSPMFMGIVALGYVSGVLHKIFYSYNWVIWLYVLNFAMVSFDLYLYCLYSARAKANALKG